MAISFDFYKTPTPKEKGKKEKDAYHARVVGGQTIEVDTLVHHIHERCTLTKGDIQAVIDELSDELVYELTDGNHVHIPGIGYFSLALSAPLDADPKTTRNQHIEIKKVAFRADQRLKDNLKEKAIFKRAEDKVHSTQLSNTEIDSLVFNYFKKNPYLTRPTFQELCGFTYTTARNHLIRLVNEGKLIKTNGDRLPIYLKGEKLVESSDSVQP